MLTPRLPDDIFSSGARPTIQRIKNLTVTAHRFPFRASYERRPIGYTSSGASGLSD